MGTTSFGTASADFFGGGLTVVQYPSDQFGGQLDLSRPLDPNINEHVLTTTLAVTFDDNAVSYAFSQSAVVIDLGVPPGEEALQHGGYAEGDILVDVFEVEGSLFNDIIRGSDSEPYFDYAHSVAEEFAGFQGRFALLGNNPGDNVLIGGGGSDVLEGREGADVLIGGSFDADFSIDFASYESSPAAVTVRLKGVGSDTQTAIATGGDAGGDTLVGIEGLIGSRFDDTLTGNSLNNVLAGGLGNDTLDGKGGIDTADYSRDHFFDNGDTADQVVVRLGLNGASGTGAEFKVFANPFGPPFIVQVSTDTLISIENVTGTAGPDTIVGNELSNTLDGRGGNDNLDGGFGDDTLIGGAGSDTASFLSHDTTFILSREQNTISLGLNGADGHATRTGFNLLGLFQTESDVLRSIENVTGSNHSETINGNEQANVLDGRGGNDILDGGLGNDTIIGGLGIDTVSYVSHDGLTPLPGEVNGIQLGQNGGDGFFVRAQAVSGTTTTVETDILRGIENVTGSNASDSIVGNELDNVLDGRGGNNEFRGLQGNDTLRAGSGDDHYFFTTINGIISTGNSTISDSGGNDAIFIDANTLADAQHVNNDLVLTLTTGATVTVLDQFGSHPVEALFNGGTPLTLATSMTGGIGSGIISGTDGNDVMDGRGGDDLLFGNGGNDRLIGGTGNDHLFGGAGNDVLEGGEGDDVLNGGPGNDRLIGGPGNDVFVVAPAASETPDFAGKAQGSGPNHATIVDFVRGQDRIDLTAFHTSFSALTGGDDHGAHDDRGDPVRLVSEGRDSVLIFAGGSARVEGVTHLDASDFIFGDNSAAPVANGNPFGEADPTARLVQAMATFSPSGLSSSGEILANTSGPFPPPDQLAPSPQNGSGYHPV